ncbi:MAG: TonB-dependent receptor [Bacteroidia bacterium]|jgi:hypothetical protein|nr:TonB-dependent receptor [Bacteroidia bacterium]
MFTNIRISLSFVPILLCIAVSNAQQTRLLKGDVRDKQTKEPLAGATVALVGKSVGTATLADGSFTLQVPTGKVVLFASYLGYQTDTLIIDANTNAPIQFRLKPQVVETQTVVITGKLSDQNVNSTEMSKVELSGESVKNLPVIFGEPDVLKAITLLPGIKSGGEGGTGFYVRGGGPDQNLVLMDDAVIYNPSHLLGFLSVFNTDAVRNVEMIKGGMPANYGGRLSSVLNVNLREGDDKRYTASGGVGLIASRLTLEGPIKREQSGFMLSARRTYIDALVRPFLPTEQRSNGYYFYDFNAKAHWYLNQRNKLYLSAYHGRDVFNFRSPVNSLVRFETNWGNSAVTLRWYHGFGKKLYVNTALIYNRYDLGNRFEFGENGFNLTSGLQDWTLKQDYNWLPHAKHKVKFGWQYIYHRFTPGIATGQVGTITVNEKLNNQFAHEGAVYILDEWRIGSRWIVNGGLRGVFFTQVGPYTFRQFDDQQLEIGTGKTYQKGEPIVTYPGLEPRFAATYLLNASTSIKTSFTRTYQFLHLATTSGAQFPADLWVPSSQRVKPQLAYQYVLGLYKNFNDNAYETSVEAYYKTMLNQIEFRPGAQLFFNQNLENEMIFGNGLSYGIEWFAKKKVGKLTGWVGYTWSRTTRQFDELNQGKPFFFRYDRTHDISIVATYQLSKKWSSTVVFVYGTGNAATLPTARYTYEPGFSPRSNQPSLTFIDVYDQINAYRLPAYHRLDISATWLRKQTKRYESSWNFSIYNVYNRANPYFIYFVPNLEQQRVQAFMVYLFPILPSVAWNFKFY